MQGTLWEHVGRNVLQKGEREERDEAGGKEGEEEEEGIEEPKPRVESGP